jgi:exosortase
MRTESAQLQVLARPLIGHGMQQWTHLLAKSISLQRVSSCARLACSRGLHTIENMSVIKIRRLARNSELTSARTLWDQRLSMPPRLALGIATLAVVVAYLPNLQALMTVWHDDPSYTHGYLVIPIALFILWQQILSSEPEPKSRLVLAPWWGWVFLVFVLLLRAGAYERGSEWLENATIIPAIVALTWSFGSWPLLRRIWPAIVFLVFMLPLPQRINNGLALPLQLLAASSSRFLLQLTGVWVIQEGNVINLATAHGMERLDVALACSGLRMLMTMAATVTATVILLPLPNWKRLVLILSIVPIALASNMARIVATGWCYYLFTGDAAKHWAHDWAGWLMMPLALALIGLELSILSWLVPKQSEDDKLIIPALDMAKKDSGKQKKKNQDLDEI